MSQPAQISHRLSEVETRAFQKLVEMPDLPPAWNGFYAGTARLRDAIAELKSHIQDLPCMIEQIQQPGTSEMLETIAAGLLEWDRRMMAVRFRGRHRTLHMDIRGLGRTYFDRIRYAAELAVRGRTEEVAAVGSGLVMPVWLESADRELKMRVVRMNSLIAACTVALGVSAFVLIRFFAR
jgi:hypothetical protein